LAANAIAAAMRMTSEVDHETLLLIAREHLKRAGKQRLHGCIVGNAPRRRRLRAPRCRVGLLI
jgi:hypothetical protein